MSRVLLLLLSVACAHAASVASTGSACDESACKLRALHHYYEELACKPVKEEGDCCASSYDCSHLANRDKSKCYFKGEALDVKPAIDELIPAACLAGCFCRQTKEAGAVATLTCAHIECPTLFNPSLIPEGCVATFSGEKCCSDGVLCPQNVTAETSKCEWAGKTYLEGEKFYPDEEPCKTCICQKGFDGTLQGPWCQKVTCGLELHYAKNIAKGCAPVFLEQNSCCPIEWRCPQEDDIVVAAATSKNPADSQSSAATCKWGGHTLRLGDSLNAPKSGPCKRCHCALPPHVTCETNGQPCDSIPPAVAEAAAPEAGVVVGAEVPAAGGPVEEAKRRPARSPDSKKKLSCTDKLCVKGCRMVNGTPECIP